MHARNMKAGTDPAPGEPANTSRPMHPAVEAMLIDNHSEFLRFLSRRLGDTNTAEEVLHQFYLRVVSKGFELRETESVISWLYAVLRTTLIDHYRRETTRRRRESEYAAMQTSESETSDHGPEETDCGCLYKVLQKLRPEYSEILQRVDLGGTPPRRVAEDLGIGANNVRVRLHRARRALRNALSQPCRDCSECDCHICERVRHQNGAFLTEEHGPVAA